LEYTEVEAYVNPYKELHFCVDLICHNCQLTFICQQLHNTQPFIS